MRITIDFPAYNGRRYGKPWIARVEAWPVGKSPSLVFGATVGTTPEIEAEPGMVVRWGQRDYRGNNTQRDWGIVRADGSVSTESAESCRAHWLAGCPAVAPEGASEGAEAGA